MDSALRAAAHSLSAFDPLAGLKRIALREDPEARRDEEDQPPMAWLRLRDEYDVPA